MDANAPAWTVGAPGTARSSHSEFLYAPGDAEFTSGMSGARQAKVEKQVGALFGR